MQWALRLVVDPATISGNGLCMLSTKSGFNIRSLPNTTRTTWICEGLNIPTTTLPNTMFQVGKTTVCKIELFEGRPLKIFYVVDPSSWPVDWNNYDTNNIEIFSTSENISLADLEDFDIFEPHFSMADGNVAGFKPFR